MSDFVEYGENIESMIQIFNNIASQSTFERMKCLGYNEFNNYNDFYSHSINCINEMTDSDKVWFNVLCNKINERKINLVDEESCAEFTAYCFYFNINKKLCIVNPR